MDERQRHALRYHLPNMHLAPAFGSDWFGKQAEQFARFFGTPTFLIAQTIVVLMWMAVNIAGLTHFDVYPFILLNLAFSLQAAYAAPLILLAQTRQADRDKATMMAEAEHREALHAASTAREQIAAQQAAVLLDLLKQNTALTEQVHELVERVAALTSEVREAVLRPQHTLPGGAD